MSTRAARSARLAGIVLLAAALVVPTPASADDYPRQAGVDVERYVFELRLHDDTDRIVGDTRIDVRFRADGVGELFLDLVGGDGSGMRVESVESKAGRWTGGIVTTACGSSSASSPGPGSSGRFGCATQECRRTG